MEKEIRFEDIFNIGELQKLMHALSDSWEVGLAIRSPEGQRYTEDCDYCELCRMVKQTPVGRIRCEKSDEILSAYKPESPYICNCKSVGLVDAGINLMVENVHIASILVGQVRVEEYERTEEEYRALAAELGIDASEYMAALSLVPRKTKKQFDSILEALSLMAGQLSQLGCSNLRQKVRIDSMSDYEQLLQKEKKTLETLAERDALTGLYNRRKLEDVMNGLETSEINRNRVFMVSIDVNNLKLTNDIFGHETGDQLLKVVGRYLSEIARADWIVARCGGDEFRVLATEVTDKESILNYCDRVLRNCRKDSALSIPAYFSYGVARWEDGESIYNCFERADEDMYKQKYRLREEQTFPDDVLEKLYERNILDKVIVDATMDVAGRFADYMGYDEELKERLILTAHYQDLGMVQVPERVMIKAANRTEETWKYLHAHPSVGHLLAHHFSKTEKVADIILQTHESWDGNGYPEKLKGEEISLESRIIRLIGSYIFWVMPSKITVDRTLEEVRNKMEGQRGSMFDPALLDKFLQFLEDGGFTPMSRNICEP